MKFDRFFLVIFALAPPPLQPLQRYLCYRLRDALKKFVGRGRYRTAKLSLPTHLANWGVRLSNVVISSIVLHKTHYSSVNIQKHNCIKIANNCCNKSRLTFYILKVLFYCCFKAVMLAIIVRLSNFRCFAFVSHRAFIYLLYSKHESILLCK